MSDAPELLETGPSRARTTLVLAHGAGAGMETPFMDAVAEGLGERGIRVVRFEFPYMARRRVDGKRRGPDRTEVLLETWRRVHRALSRRRRLAIGGKSMGGRMASLVADELGSRGLVCLGYPFHPPGKPERLRTAHLEGIVTPTLIVQGTRDPFGVPDEVAGYGLSPAVRVAWIEDGDHDLRPRKSSGRTPEQNREAALDEVASFLDHHLKKPAE